MKCKMCDKEAIDITCKIDKNSVLWHFCSINCREKWISDVITEIFEDAG